MYRITQELRKELKKPLGKTHENIANAMRSPKSEIIAVGDIVSFNLLEKKITPKLFIYDGKEKRKPVNKEIRNKLDGIRIKKMTLVNPRGTIQEEAWIAVEEALKTRTKIFILGEEDLLVIPCLLLAKSGIVLYGQPGKGVISVPINNKTKKIAKQLLSKMEVIV
jgi:uncharacterized protein (UPF0218 family)